MIKTPLTRAARTLADTLGIDPDTVRQYAVDALTRPRDASFFDEDLYVTHTLTFHTPDWDLTNDYLDGEANYRAALSQLTELYPRDVEAASIGHWTYSRYSCIKVRVLTQAGNITPAFVYTAHLIDGLRDYPLLDEELYFELERELWDTAFDQEFDYYLSQHDIDADTLIDGFKDQLYMLVTDAYGPGYSDPGWINDEWLTQYWDDAQRALDQAAAEAAGQVPLDIP